MSSPPLLDFDALTAPLVGERPTGEDLRDDPSPASYYYRAKDARSAARAAERSVDEADKANAHEKWREILKLGPEILTTSSKDLDIVAWLIEALVRHEGFAGLRDGLRLARELCETYWDDLYPQPDEDGVFTRIAQLSGLIGGEAEGTLMVPIALTPITADGEFGEFSKWRYEKAREVSKLTDQADIDAALAQGGATLDQFEATVRSTDAGFFKALVGDLEESLEHLAALMAILDDKCGPESPSSSSLRRALTDTLDAVKHAAENVAGIFLDEASAEPSDAAATEEDAAAATAGTPAAAARQAIASGEIHSREDAFRTLSKVAEWFRETEPHSPLSSLLNQAVRWGRLPLDKLIEELIPDGSARSHFEMVTGMRSSGASSDDDE